VGPFSFWGKDLIPIHTDSRLATADSHGERGLKDKQKRENARKDNGSNDGMGLRGPQIYLICGQTRLLGIFFGPF
jgi:hypothetical protein